MTSTGRASTFVVPGGLTLATTAWGPDQGTPVVILHGFLDQGPAWSRVAAALAPRRVLALDHRGHGLSEHIGRGSYYSFWDYVSDLDAWLTHLGEPVDLVGHSMGGTMAGLFAATRPERVRRLVLVEGLGPPDSTPVALAKSRTALDHRADPPKHPSFPDAAAAAERMRRYNPGLSEAFALALARRVTRPVQPHDPLVRSPDPARLTWTWDPRHRMRSPRPFDPRQHRIYLEAIEAPTLVIDGADSPMRRDDITARRSQLRQHTHVVIDRAGHSLHFDQPEALARAIATHLGR